MKKRYVYYCNLCILIAISFFFFATCQSGFDQNIGESKSQLSMPECRLFKHDLGESCVPLNPQRVIVAEQITLEPLIALGLKPIGIPDATFVGSKTNFLKSQIAGITYIGKEGQLNLEKILKLHPDLIISLYDISLETYRLFSQIAPTVKFKYVHAKWQESFRRIAEVLNKAEQAEKLLNQYEQRLTKLRAALDNHLNKLEVSVGRFHGGVQLPEFRSQFSFPVSILKEAGIAMPNAQRGLVKNPDETLVILNLERIDLLDADVLFVAVDPGARELFQKYQKTRLWQTLNVVQNQRVYSVDSSYWIFGSILSANAILDDLFKYLLQAA